MHADVTTARTLPSTCYMRNATRRVTGHVARTMAVKTGSLHKDVAEESLLHRASGHSSGRLVVLAALEERRSSNAPKCGALL